MNDQRSPIGTVTRTRAVTVLTAVAVVAGGSTAFGALEVGRESGVDKHIEAASAPAEVAGPALRQAGTRAQRMSGPPILPSRTEAEAALLESAARRRGTTLEAVDRAQLHDSTGPVPAREQTALRATAAPAASTTPTFTSLGTGGLVTAPVQRGSWAPDGSRFAYRDGTALKTAGPGAAFPILVARTKPSDMAWSPDGHSIVHVGASTFFDLSAPRGGKNIRLSKSGMPSGNVLTALSWLDDNHLLLSGSEGVGRPPGSPGIYVYSFGDPVKAKRLDLAALPPAATDGHVRAAMASPDGLWIAYVLTVGVPPQDDSASEIPPSPDAEVWVMDRAATTAVKLSSGQFILRPVWSADSSTVYVSAATSSTSRSVTAHPRAGGTPTLISSQVPRDHGLFRRPMSAGPAYATRYTGKDPVATAVAASRNTWTVPGSRAQPCDRGGAQSAVLVRATSWTEAVPATPLAVEKCGPLLVTSPSRLDTRVAAELRRLLPRGRTVHIVGNTTVVKPAVATGLTRLGYRVVRYAGADPYSTSVQVATRGFRTHKRAIFASALSYTDGLTASAPAAAYGVPVLLTAGTRLPPVVARYARTYRISAWAVGFSATRAVGWSTRLFGRTPADTSEVVARNFYLSPSVAVIANAAAYPDALAAGSVAGQSFLPLLFTRPTVLDTSVARYISANSGSIDYVEMFGRPTVPSAAVLRRAVALAGGRIPR